MRCLLVLAVAGLAWAQEAQVSGLIYDSTGGTITGANVTITHDDTGIRRNTVSNGEGVYAVTSLRPGTYKVQVRKSGFQTVVRLEVKLDSGQHLRVDFPLQVGDTREVVTVYGDQFPVDAPEGGIGSVVPRKLVENLPLNGRSLLSLLDMAPGVLTVPVRANDTGQFSVNGQRVTSNYITVDGVSANFGLSNAAGAVPSYSPIGSMHTVISLEALEEFRVETSSANAEFGRFSGGQLVLHSRSGGNEWHAGAFVLARDEALDANDWFLNSRSEPRPPFRWWQFGGTVGGPIRRNRSFLFVASDGFSLRQSQSASAIVPVLELRHSAPAFLIPLLNLYAAPNGPQVTPWAAEYVGPLQRRSSLDAANVRVDHSLRPGIQLFTRYQHTPSSMRTDSVALPMEIQSRYGLDQITAGIGITHTPYAQQEMRIHWGTASVAQRTVFTAPDAPDLFAFAPAITPRDSTFLLLSPAGYDSVQEGPTPPRHQTQWNVVDTFSVLRGNHLWKAGVDWRRLRDWSVGRGYSLNADSYGLDSLASGSLTTLAVARQDPYAVHFSEISAFVQDTWKIGSRVLLTLGLRWEWYGSAATEDRAPLYALSGMDAGYHSRLQIAPAGTPLWQNRGTNFAPRAGIAWRITRDGTWIARAGVGLHYDPGTSGLFSVLPSGTSFRIFFNVDRNQDSSQLPLPEPSSGPPFSTFKAYAPDFRPPHVWEGNLTLERSLRTGTAVSASWVGIAGRDLVRREVQQVSSPDFQVLDVMTNYGFSDYNALQFQLRQRAFHGLEAVAAYNWSHSIDNGSHDTDATLPGGRLADRGNSSFDVRHAFTASFAWDPTFSHGWGVDGILRARSGFPVEMNAGFEAATASISSAYRPDYDASQPVWIVDPKAPGGRALNPVAFPVPYPQRQGTLGRNVIPGFGFAQMDMAVRREFRLAEGMRIQLRVEAFNVGNHANFGNPVGATLLSSFGRAAGLQNTDLGRNAIFGFSSGDPNSGLLRDLQIGGPRTFQLQLRFRF